MPENENCLNETLRYGSIFVYVHVTLGLWVREEHVVSECALIFWSAILDKTDKMRSLEKPCFRPLVESENRILRNICKHCFFAWRARDFRHGFRFIVGAADGNAYNILSFSGQNFGAKEFVVLHAKQFLFTKVGADECNLPRHAPGFINGKNDDLLGYVFFVHIFLRHKRLPTAIVKFIRAGYPARKTVKNGETILGSFKKAVYGFKALIRQLRF